MSRKELTIHIKAVEIVENYLDVLNRLENAFNEIYECETVIGQTLGTNYINLLPGIHRPDNRMFEKMHRKLKKKVWKYVIRQIGIKKLASIKRAEELDKRIEDDNMPEISVVSIFQMIDMFMANADTIAKELIVEVYDYLRPRDSYKSNSEWKVSGRLIIKNVIEHWGRGFQVKTRDKQEIKMIDKVFHLLAGKPFLASSHYTSPLLCAIESCENMEGETELFQFRIFHNGNMHLWIKDSELEKKFNQVAGGCSLMPAEENRI